MERDVARVALFAALIAALGLIPQITLPFAGGVPITAQTLGVMLAGLIRGPWRGALAILVFIAVVALGAPLLAGGRGGFGVFAGPSAGFLFGWVAGALVVGWLIERGWAGLGFARAMMATSLGGIVVVYLVGIPWLAVAAEMTLWNAAIAAGAFIPGDLIKAGIASAVILGVKRSYPLIAVQ